MTGHLLSLWDGWTTSVPVGLLVVLLVLGASVWLMSTVWAAREARKRHLNVFGWALFVGGFPLAITCLALFWPGSFPWLVAGTAAAAVLASLLARLLLDRTSLSCPRGHAVAADWAHCPFCPPPRPAVPVAQPVWAPATPSAGATIAGVAFAGAAPRITPGPYSQQQILVRLIAESPGATDHTVMDRGALIGRNPQADVVVDDQGVSWDHARVVDRDGSAAVVDLGSANGTFINGERIESSLLITGDRLRIGDTTFRVMA